MAHFLTNRGKLLLSQGDWDDVAAGDLLIGLLQGASIPTSIDTAAEVAVLNTVADLLAAAGVSEATHTNYARTALSRTPAAEDDANNRVNLDAGDVVLASQGGAVNNQLFGAFVFKTGGNDTLRQLVSVLLFGAIFTTNGSGISLGIADLYRLT